MGQSTIIQLQKYVDAFNEKHKVGDKVKLLYDSGETKEVTISSPASVLGGHSAVGWFEEISGCFDLTRVKK